MEISKSKHAFLVYIFIKSLIVDDTNLLFEMKSIVSPFCFTWRILKRYCLIWIYRFFVIWTLVNVCLNVLTLSQKYLNSLNFKILMDEVPYASIADSLIYAQVCSHLFFLLLFFDLLWRYLSDLTTKPSSS